MDNFVYDDKSVMNAETLKNVQANFSFKSCESLPKVFQKMFPDSVIAKNVTFSKDKVHITSIMVSDLTTNQYLPMRSKHPHIIYYLLTKL